MNFSEFSTKCAELCPLIEKCHSEEDCKNKLVLPMLQFIGYNEFDFSFEKPNGSKFVDIAIDAGRHKAAIAVEVKSLSVPLESAKNVCQLEDYVRRDCFSVGILTNGKDYAIYTRKERKEKGTPSTIVTMERLHGFDISSPDRLSCVLMGILSSMSFSLDKVRGISLVSHDIVDAFSERFMDGDKGAVRTVPDEYIAFGIVTGVLSGIMEPSSIVYKDTKSYFGISLRAGGKDLVPLCKLYLEGTSRRVDFFRWGADGNRMRSSRNVPEEMEQLRLKSVQDLATGRAREAILESARHILDGGR